MATTSSRLLTTLSLFTSRARWTAAELAAKLEVSVRTVQRDIESLRDLGYPILADRGRGGGYSFGPGGRLPPLMLDETQAVAVAVALQTAPVHVQGDGGSAASALAALREVMPVRARADAGAVQLTAAHNPWEFLAAPVAPEVLVMVGSAVRRSELLTIEPLAPDGAARNPRDADFRPPRTVEPYDLVAWAGRWYVVVRQADEDAWSVHRLDRVRVRALAGRGFVPGDRPYADPADHVVSSWDRGDVVPAWPCVGEVLMDLPATVAARWVPAGAVVEPAGPGRCRFTLGAWSWAAVLGLLLTFDAAFEVQGPEELRRAARDVAARCGLSGALTPAQAAGAHQRSTG